MPHVCSTAPYCTFSNTFKSHQIDLGLYKHQLYMPILYRVICIPNKCMLIFTCCTQGEEDDSFALLFCLPTHTVWKVLVLSLLIASVVLQERQVQSSSNRNGEDHPRNPQYIKARGKRKREENETKQEKVVYFLAFLTFREATNQQWKKMFLFTFTVTVRTQKKKKMQS